MKLWIVPLSALILLGGAGCQPPPATPPPVGTPEVEGPVLTSYDEALSRARSENKPLLIVTYQGDPNMVDQMILSEPSITQRTWQFVVAKLDADAQAADMTKLNVTQHPTVIVMRPDGTVVFSKRAPAPPEVEQAMAQATGGAPAQ